MPDRDWRFGNEGGSSPAYRITLACGHTIRTRNSPWRLDTRYSCPAGQGCGYRLAWASWTCGDVSSTNPTAAVNPPPGPD
jgi:hypothetical protein